MHFAFLRRAQHLCGVLFLALLSLSPRIAAAQQSGGAVPEMEDSKTAIDEGIKLYDKGSYKAAMARYRSISEGDTNYAVALNEMVITALADSSYREVLQLTKTGLGLPGIGHAREFILYQGHAYDYLGKEDSALACYNSLIAMNPYDHQPWYERAALFFIHHNYDSAIASLQHSLMLNPWHFRSHNLMGASLAMQGRLTEAWLAASTALFTTSDASQAGAAISLLSKIENQSDEIAKAYGAKPAAYAHPLYDEIDPILAAKLALSKDYTYNSELAGDGVINTLHAVMEKLRYDPSDRNFVMQYYVPLYVRNFKDDRFDPFMLQMFGGFGIEKVEKLAKKQKSDIKLVAEEVNDYLSQIISSQKLPFNRGAALPLHYMYLPSDAIFVKGNITSKSPIAFGEGPVSMYKTGVLFAEGSYNAAGNKQGTWKHYYGAGQLESVDEYQDGVQVGRSEEYSQAGILIQVTMHNAAGEETESTRYTSSGLRSSHSVKKGDVVLYTSYLPGGRTEYETLLVAGKVPDGTLRTFNKDGKPATSITFSGGERNGVYKEYYSNGNPGEESYYKEGKLDGVYNTWYRNGKPHYKAGYSKGKLDGPYEEYDNHGRLIARGTYHNGKKKGDDLMIDPATGRTFGTITYRNDLPAGFRFTDAAGKVLSESGEGHEFTLLISYYPDGLKMNEVPYNNGKADGIAKYYYSTGGLSKTVTYTAGNAEGLLTEYYHNGKKSREQWFKNDDQDGYCRAWHPNGVLSSEGFMKGGNRVGQWHTYTTSGAREEDMYYVDGELNGPDKNYFANGKIRYTDYYHNGLIMGMMQYDTSGREIAHVLFPKGDGYYQMKVLGTGATSFECALKGGLYNGPYVKHYPDGTVAERGTFRHGRRDSLYQSYYPTGVPIEKGTYVLGQREGVWTGYDRNGSIGTEIYWEAGERQGVQKIWDGGMLRSLFYNFDGQTDSLNYYYGDAGKVACVLRYDNGTLTGYAGADALGHALAMTAVAHGTAHVTTQYPGGGKAVDMTFDRDSYDGVSVIYYTNGKPAESRPYVNRAITGDHRKWMPGGQVIYACSFRDDERTGTEYINDNDGTPLAIIPSAPNGTYHGKAEFAGPKGGKKITVRYYYDVPVGF